MPRAPGCVEGWVEGREAAGCVVIVPLGVELHVTSTTMATEAEKTAITRAAVIRILPPREVVT